MPQTLTFSVVTISDQSHVFERVTNISTTHTIKGGVLFLCDATSGAFTITLPPAAQIPNRIIHIKKVDAVNNVTVDGNGSETIDGALTETLSTQYEVLTVVSDGSNWFITSKQVPIA